MFFLSETSWNWVGIILQKELWSKVKADTAASSTDRNRRTPISDQVEPKIEDGASEDWSGDRSQYTCLLYTSPSPRD